MSIEDHLLGSITIFSRRVLVSMEDHQVGSITIFTMEDHQVSMEDHLVESTTTFSTAVQHQLITMPGSHWVALFISNTKSCSASRDKSSSLLRESM